MSYDYLRENDDSKLSIGMVSDFFYPNVGGIESHIYALSQCLISRGHRVTVICHSYGDRDQRQGVRFMYRGLKVYYIPMFRLYRGVIYPFSSSIAVVRDILIREQIDILHGHSSFSTLACESLIHAQAMGIPTVFTDHSLFGFANLSAVLWNFLLGTFLVHVDQVICVSHTCKENSVLRLNLDPNRVFVIPNALDISQFKPDTSAKDLRYVTIVVISRLVYRKGLDLLVAVIPPLCALFPNIRFIIGGDGPKRLELEEVRELHQLHSRVQLCGSLLPSGVRSLLIQGDIFLNTSLTEAFCIAILEAVSCGLLVVCTSVGGVPEVLPGELIRLAPARASGLAKCVAEAIQEVMERRQAASTQQKLHSVGSANEGTGQCKEQELINSINSKELDEATRCQRMHEWVGRSYSWSDVARRTEVVYWAAMARPRLTFRARVAGYLTYNKLWGLFLVFMCCLHWWLLQFVCWLRPEQRIWKVPYLAVPIEDESENKAHVKCAS